MRTYRSSSAAWSRLPSRKGTTETLRDGVLIFEEIQRVPDRLNGGPVIFGTAVRARSWQR